MKKESISSKLVVGGICFLFGISLAWIAAFSRPNNTPASLEASIEALVIAVNHLDTQIESIASSSSQEPDLSGAVVERRSNLEPVLTELVTRLSGLERALDGVANSGNTSVAPPAIGSEFIQPNVSERYPRNETALLQLRNNQGIDNSIGFLGLSYGQVLRMFGSPNQATFNQGGINFYYEDLPGEGYVSFGFRNERVIYVETDWDE